VLEKVLRHNVHKTMCAYFNKICLHLHYFDRIADTKEYTKHTVKKTQYTEVMHYPAYHYNNNKQR